MANCPKRAIKCYNKLVDQDKFKSTLDKYLKGIYHFPNCIECKEIKDANTSTQ